MKNNNYTDLYDLFLRHSQKDLSSKELDDFSERLNNDEVFRNEFQEYELSRQFFIQKELFDVEDIIKDLENTSSPTSTNNSKYWIGGSLLVAILLALGIKFSSYTSPTISKIDSAEPHQIISNQKSDQIIRPNNIKTVDQPIIATKTEEADTEKNNISVALPVTNESVISTNTSVNEIVDVPEKVENNTIIINNNSDNIPKEKTIPSPVKEIITTCPTISFTPITEKTCREEATGSIQVQNVQGGQTPYLFIINEEASTVSAISNLEAGTYQVSVKDNNGCVNSKKVTIMSKTCINKHYEFAYSYQDSWIIPVSRNGTISIYNQQGRKITSLTLEKDIETEWNGLDNNGNALPTGLYPFVIELEDQKLSGSLSIYP